MKINFTTRVRAVVVSSVTALLVLGGLIDRTNSLLHDLLLSIGVIGELDQDVFAALLISFILIVGVVWVLYFKVQGISFVAIAMFPGVAIFPYVLAADRVVSSITDYLSAGAAALLATAVYWLVSYLLILSANVLNGAVLYDIPLGQAGKAAQFIFSLVSLYLLYGFTFSVGLPIHYRIIMIALFSAYFSFSSIWVLQISMRQVIINTLAITTMLVYLTLLMAVWPIQSVYVTLLAVIFMYMMLNIALEMREKLSNMLWIEYGLLLALAVLILITNSTWGINGVLL